MSSCSPIVLDDDLRGARLDRPLLHEYGDVDAQLDDEAGDEAAEPCHLERDQLCHVLSGEGRQTAVAEVRF